MIVAVGKVANTATLQPIRIHSFTTEPMAVFYPTAAGAIFTPNFSDIMINVFLKGLIKPGLRFGNDSETGHDRYADGNSEGNTH